MDIDKQRNPSGRYPENPPAVAGRYLSEMLGAPPLGPPQTRDESSLGVQIQSLGAEVEALHSVSIDFSAILAPVLRPGNQVPAERGGASPVPVMAQYSDAVRDIRSKVRELTIFIAALRERLSL